MKNIKNRLSETFNREEVSEGFNTDTGSMTATENYNNLVFKEMYKEKKQIFIPVVIGVLTALLTGFVFYKIDTNKKMDVFRKNTEIQLNAIVKEVDKYNKLISSFSTLISSSETVNAINFYKYTEGLIKTKDYKSLNRIDYIEFVEKNKSFYEDLQNEILQLTPFVDNPERKENLINYIEKNKVINEKRNTENSSLPVVTYTYPLISNLKYVGEEFNDIKSKGDLNNITAYNYRDLATNALIANIIKKVENDSDNSFLVFNLKLDSNIFNIASIEKNMSIGLVVYSSLKDGKRIVYNSSEKALTENEFEFKETYNFKIADEDFEVVMFFYKKNSDLWSQIIISILLGFLIGLISFSWINKEKKVDTKVIEKMEEELRLDDLTGLLNRRACLQDLKTSLTAYKKNINSKNLLRTNKLTLIFIDLDGFKRINDTLGHSYGDYVLKEYGNRLKNLLSSLEGTSIYRLGGDEFTVILNNQLDEDVVLVLDSILELTKNPFNIQDENYYVTQSMGVSSFPQNAWDAEMLLKNADMAMYEAKKVGKNCYMFFNQKMSEEIKKKNKIVNNINEALEKDEFKMVYQLKVNISPDGKYRYCGVEALIRWENERLGNVPPNVFIPVIEEHGLIEETTRWIVNKICEEFKDLIVNKDFKISINLSAKQLNNMDIAKEINDIISKYNLKPENFVIEITETTMMREPELAKIGLQKLKDLGFMISVDDFGTGYSSLSYLRQFPVDEIKIDKSFTDLILNDHHTQVIVEGIIRMSRKLNINVVMEGIETKEQLDWVIDRKDGESIQIQGYYFSKPLSKDELIKFIKK